MSDRNQTTDERAWRYIHRELAVRHEDDGGATLLVRGNEIRIGPAIARDLAWEIWVGQCDAGLWLGRSGDGSCFDTETPERWAPLPNPPEREDWLPGTDRPQTTIKAYVLKVEDSSGGLVAAEFTEGLPIGTLDAIERWADLGHEIRIKRVMEKLDAE
jgi:hypothetical protein